MLYVPNILVPGLNSCAAQATIPRTSSSPPGRPRAPRPAIPASGPPAQGPAFSTTHQRLQKRDESSRHLGCRGKRHGRPYQRQTLCNVASESKEVFPVGTYLLPNSLEPLFVVEVLQWSLMQFASPQSRCKTLTGWCGSNRGLWRQHFCLYSR